MRLRKWQVYDAVRKSERTVVNFDLRDGSAHGDCVHVPECFWMLSESMATQRVMLPSSSIEIH